MGNIFPYSLPRASRKELLGLRLPKLVLGPQTFYHGHGTRLLRGLAGALQREMIITFRTRSRTKHETRDDNATQVAQNI